MRRLLLMMAMVLTLVVSVVSAAPQSEPHASTTTSHTTTTAAEGHGEHHEEAKFLGLPAWIFKLINLILFIGVLVYLLKGPIGGAFRDRRAGIKTQLVEAQERRAKADRLAQDIQARLDLIEGEVAAILQRAREEGERQKSELVAAAEVESQKILAQARNEVDTNLKAARLELSAHARHLAAQRAEEIVRGAMTDADRRRLFEESVKKVSEVRA